MLRTVINYVPVDACKHLSRLDSSPVGMRKPQISIAHNKVCRSVVGVFKWVQGVMFLIYIQEILCLNLWRSTDCSLGVCITFLSHTRKCKVHTLQHARASSLLFLLRWILWTCHSTLRERTFPSHKTNIFSYAVDNFYSCGSVRQEPDCREDPVNTNQSRCTYSLALTAALNVVNSKGWCGRWKVLGKVSEPFRMELFRALFWCFLFLFFFPHASICLAPVTFHTFPCITTLLPVSDILLGLRYSWK
jgi:hypothetical protein